MSLSSSALRTLLEALRAGLGDGEPVSLPDPYAAGASVHLLQVAHCPAPDLYTWCTLGLAELDWSSFDFPHRVELLFTAPITRPEAAAGLALLAGHVRARQWLPMPGFVLRNGLASAGVSGPPHLYVTYPFAWPRLAPITLGPTRVFPLLAMPLHEREAALRDAEGEEVLEAHLGEAGVAIWDLDRPSSV